MTLTLSACLSRATFRKAANISLLGLAICAAPAWSETIIKTHAFSDLGEIKYSADFTHLDYVNPNAPKGGEISSSRQGTFDSLNAYSRKGRGAALSVLPFERMMTSTDDDPYASYCLLCETLEYPESQEWVIFNLRKNIKFSDGTPATAHDIKFTVDLFLEQGLPSFAQAVKQLYKSVEVLDDHRIKFTFQPDIPRKGLISQAGASIMFSKKWFDETDARLDEPHRAFTPGSGPYFVEPLDRNQSISVRRNQDYWGKDLPINRGRYNFDVIREEYFADTAAAFEAFKSGVFTFRQEGSSLQWATAYQKFPNLTDGHVIKKELENGNLPSATGFAFNLRKEKFQDIRVRQALALMYNFTWTNETLQYGLFKQRESFWHNTELAATGKPEGLELEYLEQVRDHVDPEIFSEDVTVPHASSDRQLDRRNLRKALALLEDAGYETGDDGIMRKDGQTLKVEILEQNPSFDRIFQPFIENLKRLGVEANYNRIDPAQYTNRTRDFDYDIVFDLYRNGLEEGQGLAQRYGSEDAQYSLFNPAGYSSEAVDILIEKVLAGSTYEEMEAGLRAIDRIMRRALFIVPVYFNDKYWVAYYDQYEHPEKLPPFALGHYDFWWYNADKAEALKAAGALN
ncbi:MAG: extracellular solute-binding protein [Litoreibacter sp.]